jgi:hypothetical protein
VTTTGSNFAVSPSGVLNLVSSASWTGPSRQAALPGTVVFYRHSLVAPSGGQVSFSVTHLPPTPVAG